MTSFVVDDLDVGRAGQPLLRGLSFRLAPGERVALVGPSGVGKTTALRAFALLDDPLGGSMSLGGASPEALGVPGWRRRVLLVAQRASFLGGSVSDELARPWGYASAEGAFPEEAARDTLERLGLRGKWESPSHALSEGEMQRVALARALILAPDVLLLDEPTSALDPATTEAAEALLVERGASIVLVSHQSRQRERLDARPIDLSPLRVPEVGGA